MQTGPRSNPTPELEMDPTRAYLWLGVNKRLTQPDEIFLTCRQFFLKNLKFLVEILQTQTKDGLPDPGQTLF